MQGSVRRIDRLYSQPGAMPVEAKTGNRFTDRLKPSFLIGTYCLCQADFVIALQHKKAVCRSSIGERRCQQQVS